MDNTEGGLYGGRYRRVLHHPDHREGVNYGTMTLTGLRELAPSVVRITARLEHEGDRDRWRVTNPAIRLELPDVTSTTTVSRVYTVRECRIDDDGITIDVDIVRHAGLSPVMRWLDEATVGTSVPILGPRPHFCPAFVDCAPVGLFADETAIPALATILRDWPAGHVGKAWVEHPTKPSLTTYRGVTA